MPASPGQRLHPSLNIAVLWKTGKQLYQIPLREEMFWLRCLSFGLLVQHIFLDNQLNKMKSAVETDSGADCTSRMHSIPRTVNFKIEKMANFMLCVFHHNKKFEEKNRQIVRSQTWKSKGLSPPMSLLATSSFVPEFGPQSQGFTARSITWRKPVCLSLV